jgi:hypothetical protein
VLWERIEIVLVCNEERGLAWLIFAHTYMRVCAYVGWKRKGIP